MKEPSLKSYRGKKATSDSSGAPDGVPLEGRAWRIAEEHEMGRTRGKVKEEGWKGGSGGAETSSG